MDISAVDPARGITLPALVRRYRNPAAYFVAWAPYIATYQLSNRWPLRPPVALPFTSLDHAVAFVPALLPLYVAYIPFFFWTVARSRTDAEVNRLFYGTYLQLLLSLPVFLLFPVTMPRHLFYGAEIFGWADAFWRWFDAPNNCLPSLHVSNCLLLMQFNWRRPLPALHTVLALGIIASTVLVKQHYVLDAAAGALVYLIVRSILQRVRIAGEEG